jgi:hypothetical protein
VKADRYAGAGPRWAAGATLVYGPTCPGLTMAKIRPFTCKVPDPKPRPSATVTPGTHDSASAAVAPGWSGSGQL